MSRPIRRSRLATVVILITLPWLAGAAAEARTPAAPAAAPPDACGLLTKELAATALGEAAKGPKALVNLPAGPDATLSSCEYTGSGDHRVQLNLTRLPAKSVPMYRGICAQKATKDLAGIGEVACWYDAKHEELHALEGTAFLTLELRRGGNPTESIKAAMKKALASL